MIRPRGTVRRFFACFQPGCGQIQRVSRTTQSGPEVLRTDTPELFRAADDALFESKRHGRNRIRIAASVGLDGESAKSADADRDSPASTEVSADAGPGVVEYPLGELGEDLKA